MEAFISESIKNAGQNKRFLGKFLIIILLASLLILGVLFLSLNYSITNTSRMSEKNGAGGQEMIDVCRTQHPDYPVLSDILTTKSDMNYGVYHGMVSKVDTADDSLEIKSIPSGNKFTFKDLSGVIYDIHHQIIKQLSAIQPGVKTVVSFPCLQENGRFVIHEVQMVK